MSELVIEDAVRVGINPLIAFYSESGAGKTYTALLMARGIAGPNGKMVMIDTENKRGSIYADLPIFGGYKRININEPYNPSKFVEAIGKVEDFGAAVGILDSGSMEWDGVGGVTDLAAEIEEKKGKGLHCWRAPKFEHQKFVQRLMRSRIPWIVCLRAKFKTRQTKVNGKTEIIKDDWPSPIQAEDFIFEATCHALILPDTHDIKLTKWSHPGLRSCFPDKGPIELKHGELIAKWCAAGGQNLPSSTHATKKAADPLASLKAKLWTLTESKHGGKSDDLEAYLKSANLIDPDAKLSTLTEATLKYVIGSIEAEGLP